MTDKITIGGQEFSTACPSDCPVKYEPFYQGNLCCRCPIFNCTGEFRLLEPEEYREDWALEFKKWFDSGMKDYPKLYLVRKTNNESK